MSDKNKRFEFKLSDELFDRLHTIANQRSVSAGSLLRRSIQRLKLGKPSRERPAMPKQTPKPKRFNVEQLTDDTLEQDAEATRLLDGDPTYKRNIKHGEPIPDRQGRCPAYPCGPYPRCTCGIMEQDLESLQ